MQKEYIEDQNFDKVDFTREVLVFGEYEHCHFSYCDFSNVELSGIGFMECSFVGCNLSLVKLGSVGFRDVRFKDCKMLGLYFDHCNPFGFSVSFEGCVLTHSSFYQMKLKKIVFKGSKLEEVDFTECDLSGAIFLDCDLVGATFEQTILEKADFRSAYNYSIDPTLNRIKKAKFSLVGVRGLLDKFGIEIS